MGTLSSIPGLFRRPTQEELAAIPQPKDYGFFGPGSVAWKVWSYPSSVIMGFQRAVTIEQLDPHLNAAVEDAGGVRTRPRTRYERTVRYFAIIAFGDTQVATKAADVLVKVHSKSVGIDPVTGTKFDGNAAESQLWIHVTAWYSILVCFEQFGGGKLTPAEEQEYWNAAYSAAMLQTIDLERMPRNRNDARQYLLEWRPKMAASERAQDMANFILNTEVAFPEQVPEPFQTFRKPLSKVFGMATVATYPAFIKKMFGIHQGPVSSFLALKSMKLMFRFIADHPSLYWHLGHVFVPGTMSLIGPLLFDIAPEKRKTMSPREAQALYGYDIPGEAHTDVRARQEQRVFGEGKRPTDEGLLESERFIGAMADGAVDAAAAEAAAAATAAAARAGGKAEPALSNGSAPKASSNGTKPKAEPVAG